MRSSRTCASADLAGILQSLQGLERDSTRSPFAKMQPPAVLWRKHHKGRNVTRRAAWAALSTVGVLFVCNLSERFPAFDVAPALASFVTPTERSPVINYHSKNQAISKFRPLTGEVQFAPVNRVGEIGNVAFWRNNGLTQEPMIANDNFRWIAVIHLVPARDADPFDYGSQLSSIRYAVNETGVVLDDGFRRISDYAPNEDVGALGDLKCLGGGLGGLGTNSRRLVSTNQEKDLDAGNGSEQRSKNGENKRIEGNWIVPRPIPDYRKRLPEGFGWLILIGFGIGGGIGVAFVLLVIWVVNSPDKTTAN